MANLIFKQLLQQRGKVTKHWAVTNKAGHDLGRVYWHAPWRRYVLEPSYVTLWDSECLAVVQDFLVKETDRRREERGLNSQILSSTAFGT